jgi:Spy/CpxP family protein refolding chaperone
MKLTKTTLAVFAAAGLLSVVPVSNAQNQTNKPTVARPGGPGARGLEGRMTALAEHLKLTDEQKPKVKAILEEQDKKRAELRNASQEERRSKMQALNEETNKKMKEVLTADQFSKYEEFNKQQRARRGAPGEAPGAPGAAHEGTHSEKPADKK